MIGNSHFYKSIEVPKFPKLPKIPKIPKKNYFEGMGLLGNSFLKNLLRYIVSGEFCPAIVTQKH